MSDIAEHDHGKLLSHVVEEQLRVIGGLEAPFAELNEARQKAIIVDVRTTADRIIRDAIRVVQHKGCDHIGVTLGGFTVDKGAIKGKFESPPSVENITMLAERQSQIACVVFTNPEDYAKAEIRTAAPDQSDAFAEDGNAEGEGEGDVEPLAPTDQRPDRGEPGAADDERKPSKSTTPILEHYFALREAHPDCLLFYRVGDFFEVFFDDAVEVARALEIVLTKRGKHMGEDVPMCGVPAHTAEEYFDRLTAKGYRVAVRDVLSGDEDNETGTRVRLIHADGSQSDSETGEVAGGDASADVEELARRAGATASADAIAKGKGKGGGKAPAEGARSRTSKAKAEGKAKADA